MEANRPAASHVLRSLILAATALLAFGSIARASSPGAPGGIAPGTTVSAVAHATVNFGDLARAQRFAALAGERPIRVLQREQDESFDTQNEMAEPSSAVTGLDLFTAQPSFTLEAASPAATTSFPGLDDIPMVDSMYIIIPPDVSGGVGPTRLFQGSNNDYRVLDKATGATITTVGTATFWAPVVPAPNRVDLTDPRVLYDPYNNCWITETQTVTTNAGMILVGISQTSDPAGAWNLYSFATAQTIDFPNVGFNRDWIAVAINGYNSHSAFVHGLTLAVNYPSARAGTGTGTLFTQSTNTHFCSAPCVTYSTTSDTLYVVTHLSSSGATYTLDTITGTSAAPVYTANGALTRPGGGWAQPANQILPQSAPISGTSACGATPCPIEAQDSQVRSAPLYRGGFIWYTQSIGLPASGLTHVAAQWTKLNTPGGSVADGGRIEDATATSTNGGKWYSHPHVAVNANGDFLIGFTQFSSEQYPSAGYAMHLTGDAAGSLRDVVIAHAGEDYYHKTFTTTTGRNRWGDFSTAQVDPSDDLSLWTVQEYAKARTSMDDGNTGSNGSKWGTWWMAVAPPSVTLDAGPSLAEGNSGTTPFPFTARLSSVYGVPVQVQWHTSDGTATAASGDYVAASSSVTIPAGATSAIFNVSVNGDSLCEPDETFGVTLTADDRSLPITASATTATILNDDTNAAIAASAGAGGTISPSGNVVIPCGSDQSFTITPDAGNAVSQLVVDGVSVTPATSYTFTGVSGPHSIVASFSATTGVGDQPVAFGLGAVTPNPAHGAFQVSFGLASAAHARITVLDLQGRERAVLADGEFAPGSHVASWNGHAASGDAQAGVYFLRYQVAGRTFLRKFALMN